MSYIEKEKLIKADIDSIENRVRHAFNQGYDLGFKDGKEKAKPQEQELCDDWYDVPSDEMTLEQARQAVKDLRKKLMEYLEQEPTTKNDLAHNLCDSCTNVGCEFQSGIVRTKCAFYMPPHIEAILKVDYEARLKADLKAILTKLQLEIEELDFFEGEEPVNITQELMDEVKSWGYGVKECKELIQQKINALKAESEEA